MKALIFVAFLAVPFINKALADVREHVQLSGAFHQVSVPESAPAGEALIGRTFWLISYRHSEGGEKHTYLSRLRDRLEIRHYDPVKIRITDYDPTKYAIYELEMPSGSKEWVIAELIEKGIETGVLATYDPVAKERAEETAKAKAVAAKRAASRANEIKAKKWPADIEKAVIDRKIRIGMTDEQVRMAWGKPETINRSVGSWGTHEQWVYGRTYLYLENGFLKSYQDSR